MMPAGMAADPTATVLAGPQAKSACTNTDRRTRQDRPRRPLDRRGFLLDHLETLPPSPQATALHGLGRPSGTSGRDVAGRAW